MNSKQAITFLFLLIAGVVVLSCVEATRVLPQDFASANHLVMLPSVYQAKSTVTCWLGRLASGPSQGGKAH
ncbi:hypothetical protein MKW98_028987 [Papaver atlanticum]|uniref:Uncharacterized protein n=1 Tax=Papaver atlanticum TaxID=357466 RepID=A0AAD4TIY2_9MAGN|nr:hypothetical protein MKW98_028987 [Papaver atlanticum]